MKYYILINYFNARLLVKTVKIENYNIVQK